MYLIPNYQGSEALQKLEEDITTMQALLKEAKRLRGILDSLQGAHPFTGFTKSIESCENAEELSVKRRELTEGTLRYTSILWAYHQARGAFLNFRPTLGQAIKAVIAEFKSAKSPSIQSEMDAVYCNCVLAHDLIGQEVGTCYMDEYGDVQLNRGRGLLIRKVLQAEFDLLVSRIRELQPLPEKFYPTDSIENLYPLSVVTTSESVGKKSGSVVREVRKMHPVTFEDVVNGSHPACQRLPILMEQLESACLEAKKQDEFLRKNENGRINEKQHGERLFELIFTADDDTTFNTIRSATEKQTELRGNYCSARLAVETAVIACERIRVETVATLKNAVEETRDLCRQFEEEEIVTVDVERACSLALLNCLCADVLIREVGRQLQKFAVIFNKDSDLSKGAARSALSDLIKEVHRYYA